MPKDGKKYVKPGYLAGNTAYERLREKNISANNEILKALGCKQLASHFGSARPKCTNRKGKKSIDIEYDEDYTPSGGEGDGDDDGDDDSSDSLVHEVYVFVFYWVHNQCLIGIIKILSMSNFYWMKDTLIYLYRLHSILG